MKKINLYLKNPSLDFFVKVYLLIGIIPFLLLWIALQVLYFSGRQYWEAGLGGGPLTFFVVGFYFSIMVYILSFLVSIISILFLNRRFMSGSLLSKKSRFGLFGLAFLLYLVTVYLLSLFM